MERKNFVLFFVVSSTFKLPFKLICYFFNDKMIIIIWTRMKNCRNFIGHVKFYIMCRTSIFTCILTIISNFSIIYIFREIFLRILFCKYFSILFLLTVTFFSFQNQLYFLHVLLKIHRTFSCSLFPRYKVCLSSMWSNPQIVDIEYLQGICSPIFVVEDFFGLFSRPSIFIINN